MEQTEQSGGKIWISISSLYIVLLTLFVALSAHIKYDRNKIKAAQASLSEAFVSRGDNIDSSAVLQTDLAGRIKTSFRNLKSIALDLEIPQSKQYKDFLIIYLPTNVLFNADKNVISESGAKYLETVSVILKSENGKMLSLEASLPSDSKNAADYYVSQSAAIADALSAYGIGRERLKASIVVGESSGIVELIFRLI